VTSYRFIHDRVQQAANSLLGEQEKIQTHVLLGKALIQNIESEKLDSMIFEVVNHLNYGINLPESNLDNNELIKLNYKAGLRAQESFSYQTALNLFKVGITLLDESTSQELIFNLKYNKLYVLYMSGLNENFDILFDELYEISATNFQRANISNLKIIYHSSVGEFDLAIKTCCEIMNHFNMNLNPNINKREIFLYYKKLSNKLNEIEIENILKLPDIEKPEISIIMEILMNTASPAFWVSTNFASYLSLMMVNLSLEYGINFASAYGFSIYGVTLSTLGDYKNSKLIGDIALKLSELHFHNSTALKVPFILGFSIYNWVKHSNYCIELMLESFKKNINIKDYFHSSNIINVSFHISFIIGKDLNKTKNDFLILIDYLKKNQTKEPFYGCNHLFQIIQILQEEEEIWKDIDGNNISVIEYENLLNNSESKVGLSVYFNTRFYLYILLRDLNLASKYLILSLPIRKIGEGMLSYALNFFCHTLFLIWDLKSLDEIKYKDAVKEIENNIKQYKIWSENNPYNFLHKYNLILAEYAKYKKEYWNASEYYDIAIESAIQNEYNLDAGLCAELAGEFYLEQNRITQAKKYFQISMSYYDLCGGRSPCKPNSIPLS
jgi:predicted ATPase